MTYHVDYYPLTHPQKGIWYTEKLHPHTSIGNIAGSVRIREEIDYCCLEKAINILIQKNDSIRIRISEAEGEPVQYISKYNYTKIDFLDFSKKGLKELYKWDEQQTTTPFDIEGSDLFYFALIKISDIEGGFYFKLHHLISDAWTASLVINQTIEHYWQLKNKIDISVENKPSYTEYTHREENYKNSKKFIKDKDFWNSKLSDIPEITSLKANNTVIKSTRSKRKAFVIPPELASQVREYCASNKVSPFIFFLSILAVYINRIALKSDIVLGTPVLNRSNAREKNMLGMFVSTIPLRLKVDESMDFASLVQTLAKEWMLTLRHYEYPYDLLIKDIREKHKSVENLYDIVLSYQNAKLNKAEYMSNYGARWHFNGHQTNSLSIHINERENDGNIVFDYDYLAQVFTVKSIEYIHKHMLVITQDAMKNPSKKIYQLEILEEEEKKRILCDFNNTSAEYPKDKTIHQLFEEQVERTPDNIAVVFEDKQLSYRELNGKANQLARILREKGVGPDSIVGIMTGRSLDVIVGILGILKAGGAFLPIDPGYPEERIEFMLNDSSVKALVTQPSLREKIHYSGEILEIDENTAYSGDSPNPLNVNKPSDLAYVIYTSGSTGTPKGVMIEHRSMNNFSEGIKDALDFKQGGTIASITTISFDVFVFEVLPSLLNGFKVVVASEEEQKIPRLLSNLLLKHNVDKIYATPSRIQLLVEDADCADGFGVLKEIILGGEVLPGKLLNKLKEVTKAKIFNAYGPTETTIGVTIKELSDSKSINIGRPTANTQIYILDKWLNPVPIGVPGELYIGGDCLGRGYLNRPDLTKEKYIPSPFEEGARIYKTGDLARWYPQGDIEYLGRIDHQVKIRGFRVELGEIENHILKYSGIQKAIVIDKDDNQGRKYLCAYVVTDERFSIPKLRAFLTKQLPGFMVPSYFVRIDEIPLSPSGKVDRNKLPEVDISECMGEYAAPTNGIEAKLAEVWRDILQTDRIGINDSFFELGGDSLRLVTVISRIHKEFNVEVPISEIYKYPTIKELGEYLSSADKSFYSQIMPVKERDYYPMSSAQKRLFILMQFEEGSTAYNMPGVLRVEGKLDLRRLEKAFEKLIQRHEALRTSFEMMDGEPVQKIHNKVDFKIDLIETEKSETNSIIQGFIQPFDLCKPPLIRVGLIKLSEFKHILLFDMHHIISDGITMDIFLKELDRLYRGEDLRELRIQYKDFSEWQNKMLKSDFIKNQEEYWLNSFSGEIPVLNLPTDYPRPSKQSYEGAVLNFRVGKQLAKNIKRLAMETNSTLYMVLLAAYNILLSKYSGQEDILVGTPVAGRRHTDLENVIGIFVNTLAMRNHPESNMTFNEFLRSVRENTLRAFENQDYQFEELVGKLKIKRDLSRNPLFDTLFILQKLDVSEIKIGDLNIVSKKLQNRISKFDLTFEAVEKHEDIYFSIEYCTKLFNRATIVRMSKHFRNILKMVAHNPGKKLLEIDMLSEKEKHQLLYEFNNTKVDYPTSKTIHQLFEEQVERTPDAVAVVFEDKKLTYKELNEKSNRLARLLREKGVGRDSIVGIMVNRSLEMMVGIMGILKAGGAYLPIDPHYPEERINYMLEDSGTNILLTQSSLKDKIKYMCSVLYINDNEIYYKEGSNLQNINKPSDLIYVIYTSGSTGKPKGVMLTHKSVNNFIKGISDKIEFLPGKAILSVTTICFDIFVLESLMSLCCGLKMVIADEEQQKIPRLLNEIIIKNNVNMMQTTPSKMQLLLNDDSNTSCLKNLTEILLGGEALPDLVLQKLRPLTQAKIFNMYGPTETTVWSAVYNLTNASEILIGKPIANTYVYILDKFLNLVPAGVPGDLYIGGDGLARGYYNRLELTNERFIQNPFTPGERIYKTGDLAKWNFDGNIEFLGRIDNQVKIRGLRIELGEIESKFSANDLIDEAAVIAKNDKNGQSFLCAYIVPKEGAKISVTELRRYLSKELPDYMIPSYFVILDSMPLTPNGKLNRNALPEPDRSFVEGISYEPPKDEIEEKLVKVWAEVLDMNSEEIGINYNFFELGGDSLSIILAQIKIHQYGWNLTTEDFYKYQTIKEFANRVRGIVDDTERMQVPGLLATDLEALQRSFRESAAGAEPGLNTVGFKNLLLTGSTGFLGIHLLREILTETDINVYCLIRAKNKRASEERLLSLLDFYFKGAHKELLGNRIFVLNGDISLDRFGLSGEEYADLGQRVNIIIHSAANVKHFGDYSEFELINVLGTKRVIDFSLEYQKMLYHISTMSVSGEYIVDKSKTKTSFTETELYIGQNYSDNVYVRSKFEAEKLILTAMSSGLNAAICRIGNLTGRYSDGHFQINIDKNAFYNRLRSIIKLGTVPSSLLEKEVEFTPVDYCSRAIVALLGNIMTIGKVFHLYNHRFVKLEDLLQIFNSLGIDIKPLDDISFNEYVNVISKNVNKQEILMGIIQDFYNKNNSGCNPAVIIDSKITQDFLKRAEFEWPEIDKVYVSKLLDYMKSSDYLI